MAQDTYPNRPIRWVVPFPPGGPTDTLSRILAAKLGDIWRPGIVIENKGGAAGAIGTDFAAKAAPDGYTIMLGTQSTNGSNKIFYPNLPYDPITDFEPLTLLGTACMALVIPNSIPANTPRNWSSGSGSRMAASPMRRRRADRASTSRPSFWSSAPASRPRTFPIAAARRRSPT